MRWFKHDCTRQPSDTAHIPARAPLPRRYISAMGYAFEGCAQAELKGIVYDCSRGIAPSITDYLPALLPDTPAASSLPVLRQIQNPGANCVVDMGGLLDYLQVSRPFWMLVVIMVAYLLFVHIITYLGFLWLTKKEKR
eukprot:GHRQ01019043.1.p2 GENE.GHRQ01019043.1~~GHRQ01019043.1.p2  ORF type:complete len:138 (+),score=34.52 GHRQ01019043.1:165-578(+)